MHFIINDVWNIFFLHFGISEHQMNPIIDGILDLVIYDHRQRCLLQNLSSTYWLWRFYWCNNKPVVYFSITFLLNFVQKSHKLYVLIASLNKLFFTFWNPQNIYLKQGGWWDNSTAGRKLVFYVAHLGLMPNSMLKLKSNPKWARSKPWALMFVSAKQK